MLIRRRAVACVSAALLLLATASTLAAQEAKKLSKDEEREVKLLSAALGNATSGKPAGGNDAGLTWLRQDGLQAQGASNIVAFGVTVDPSKVPSGKIFLAWRVMPADADPKKKVAPIYENYSTADVSGSSPVFIGRLFLAPAGKVDVYIAGHELVADKGSKAPVSLIKQSVDVKALTGGDFMLSSLYVFRPRKYDAPLADIMEHPYGTPEEENLPLVSPTLSKTEPLRVNGMIFNATGRVTVEYLAYKDGATESFKKWAAAEIDPAKQGIPDRVPLTDFEPGKYRLEIKLTDKGSGKTLTESLPFTVGS